MSFLCLKIAFSKGFRDFESVNILEASVLGSDF